FRFDAGALRLEPLRTGGPRPGRRRWCSMERCGNRHKVRAYRSRTRTEETN
uniref:CGNR zinc finger domain-containing protein n=1 Tax=Streptomyces sp. TaxID=1931 RepID=UPI0028119726